MCHQSKSFPLATSRSYKTRESNKKQHSTIYNVCDKWCQSHQMHKATNPCLTMFTNNNNYSPYAVKSWVLSWLCMQNFWFSNVTVCSNNWAQYNYIKKPIKVKTTFTVPMSCFCGFSASPTVVIPSCKRSKIISFTPNNITDCFFMRNNVSLRVLKLTDNHYHANL